MKCFIIIASLFMLLSGTAYALQYNPRRDCALADVAVRIVDENGGLVPDAEVSFIFYVQPEKVNVIRAVSDKEGMAYAKSKCNGEAYIKVRKANYYRTGRTKLLIQNVSPNETKKTHKWSEETLKSDVVLKRIVNPQNLEWLEPHKYTIPVTNEVVGFDLRVRDWCKPFGKGEYDDLQFKADLWRSPTNYFHLYSKLEMTMTNSVDGFYWQSVDGFSSFKYAYSANTNANYQKSLTFEYDRRSGRVCKEMVYPADKFLVFRTRTKVNDNGELTEALYGFIGEGLSYWERINLSFILNPNTNDTNLELNVVPEQFKD